MSPRFSLCRLGLPKNFTLLNIVRPVSDTVINFRFSVTWNILWGSPAITTYPLKSKLFSTVEYGTVLSLRLTNNFFILAF